MVDVFGTPQSGALHLVERYRLIGGEAAKADAEREEKQSGYIGPERGAPHVTSAPQGLEVAFTVDDPAIFTTPWSASIAGIGMRTANGWSDVCADNPHNYITGRDVAVPTATTPDF